MEDETQVCGRPRGCAANEARKMKETAAVLVLLASSRSLVLAHYIGCCEKSPATSTHVSMERRGCKGAKIHRPNTMGLSPGATQHIGQGVWPNVLSRAGPRPASAAPKRGATAKPDQVS